MKRFVRLFSAIAIAMWSAQALAQSPIPPKGYRPEDIVSLMALLHREAFAAPSYSQLFKGCTGTQPPGELVGFPDAIDSQINALKVIRTHVSTLIFATDEEAKAWSRQCMLGMLSVVGPRGALHSADSLIKVRTKRGFDAGLGLVRIGAEWIVREVQAGGPAEAAGLQAGDALVTIDGVVVSALEKEFIEYGLRDSSGTNVDIVWKSKSGQLITSSVKRTAQLPRDEVFAVNVGDHVYIRISEFGESFPDNILKSLRTIPDSQNLAKVIDLRGNLGGPLLAVEWCLAIFGRQNNSRPWSPVKTRGSDSLWGVFSKERSLSNSRLFGFTRSLSSPSDKELNSWSSAPAWYVLVDGGTSSGAAWLAGTLRELNSAVLIGSTADTNSVGVDTWRSLSSELTVRYETGALLLPSGKVLLPNSVAPDVPVEMTQHSIHPVPRTVQQWKADPLYLVVQNKLNLLGR